MSAVEGSTVIGDCIAVVACVGHTVRVIGKIEPVEREGDGGTELLLESITLRESLEVDDENLGQPVERVSLRAAPSRLASFARRHLVSIKNLFLSERVEAVKKRDFARPGRDP